MCIYNTSHLAKVIETPYNTYNTFNTPPSQLLLTGVRKKSEKSCLKIWRGMGSGLYICSEQVMAGEEDGIITVQAGDYALVQIAPVADGGSRDSGGSV